jgi:hypothetical protein
MRRVLSALLLVGAALLSLRCGGSSTSDGASSSDCGPMPQAMDCINPCTQQMYGPGCVNGAWTCGHAAPGECVDAGQGCGPMPGAADCFDPCTGQMHAPICKQGSWTCDDPAPGECPDAGAACAPSGNLVPVSCTPFPETSACDPFGVWFVSYETSHPGICVTSKIDQLVVERGDDGIARVGFGTTASATLSDDGCALSVASIKDWTNPSEYGTVMHTLTLTFTGDGGSGQLIYQETGACSGSGQTTATAERQPD